MHLDQCSKRWLVLAVGNADVESCITETSPARIDTLHSDPLEFEYVAYPDDTSLQTCHDVLEVPELFEGVARFQFSLLSGRAQKRGRSHVVPGDADRSARSTIARVTAGFSITAVP